MINRLRLDFKSKERRFFLAPIATVCGMALLFYAVFRLADIVSETWAIVSGLIGFLFIGLRAIVAERQAHTAHVSLLNERFQAASTMIASEGVLMRLAGIHSLESLANENPVRYHIPVMRLFSLFLEHPPGASNGRNDGVRQDIDAVMKVVGARDDLVIRMEENARFKLVVSNADLRHHNLDKLNLSNIHFRDVKFHHASLIGTRFDSSTLACSKLNDAEVMGAKFYDADFDNVDISGAIFCKDGNNVRGLTQDQINACYWDRPPVIDVCDYGTGKLIVYDCKKPQ